MFNHPPSIAHDTVKPLTSNKPPEPCCPGESIVCLLATLWQVGTPSQHQVHLCESNLVHRTLLGWEGRNLVGRDDHVFALALFRDATAASRSSATALADRFRARCGRPVANDFAVARVRIGRLYIPHSHRAVRAPGYEDGALDAPVQAPDAAARMPLHPLDEAARGQIPEEDLASVVAAGHVMPTRRTRERRHVAEVAREDADGVAALDVPHAYATVGHT